MSKIHVDLIHTFPDDVLWANREIKRLRAEMDFEPLSFIPNLAKAIAHLNELLSWQREGEGPSTNVAMDATTTKVAA